MKSFDWKKTESKTEEKYILNEEEKRKVESRNKREFIPKVDVNKIERKKNREDVIRSLKDDITVEQFREQYNYTKFSPENIRGKYDMDSILSEEDIIAIGCLYEGIKEGNRWNRESETVINELNSTNKISKFLDESPNNIIVLINLMQKSAKKFYEEKYDKQSNSIDVKHLIPASYGDIYQLIEDYKNEIEIEGR